MMYHKYCTKGLFLPSSLILNRAKLPGIGRLLPLAHSVYILTTQSSSWEPMNSQLSPMTLQEFRSVQSRSPTMTVRQLSWASWMFFRAGWVTLSFPSLFSTLPKSDSLLDRITTPEVVRYLWASRQASKFFIKLAVQVPVCQANSSSLILQQPERLLLGSGMTMTASYCLPLNFSSISLYPSTLPQLSAFTSYSSQVFFRLLFSFVSKSGLSACPDEDWPLMIRALRDFDSTLCLMVLLSLMPHPVSFCFQSKNRKGCFEAIINKYLQPAMVKQSHPRS